ncbi:MAG: hypothetical protein CMK71_02705 [Pseudomonadaceae bacterium]|nr:hypothetical protein [Pseudomonadaceae bacterium]|tara:strand:- start:21 stop:299 length:279 start_codon:yes stop_codon:yes gene_type:complete
MNEQMTLDGQPVQKLLHVFVIGEHDYYSASTPEEAVALHCEMNDCEIGDDDCEEVTGELLDKPWTDEDGAPLGTLRQFLAEAKGPEWLTGTE